MTIDHANTGAENADETPADSIIGAKPKASRQQLSLLGLVLACGAAVAFFSLRTGPQSATAATLRTPAAKEEIAEFLAGDVVVARAMELRLRDTEKGDFGLSSTRPQVPVTELKTNPFRLATASAQPIEVRADPKGNPLTEQEPQAVPATVQSLHLQSILRGDSHRACLIGSTLYQEGQEVDGFVIEEIALNTVVLRRGACRFELKMRK